MTCKFITLSSLMKSSSLSGLSLDEIRVKLQDSCREPAGAINLSRVPDALKQLIGEKNPCDWVERLIDNSSSLKTLGFTHLVVDTLEHLPVHQLNKIILFLKNMPQHSIHVVVIDQAKTPIFLTTMREVIRTDEFMGIYVKSLWTQSLQMASHRVVAKRHSRPAAPPQSKGFKMMERIFVS